MYFWIVGSLMFALPLVSVIAETVADGSSLLAASAQKWFVFWAVGVRLLSAGLRQIIQPRYTAEAILGISDPDAMLVVRELGFANTAIGTIGVASIVAHSWVLPAAIAGIIFYGLAGANHIFHKNRNRLENIAMCSDLFVAIVILACLAKSFIGHQMPS
jgi:hypothetical protein